MRSFKKYSIPYLLNVKVASKQNIPHNYSKNNSTFQLLKSPLYLFTSMKIQE